jgi:hypothetical protein
MGLRRSDRSSNIPRYLDLLRRHLGFLLGFFLGWIPSLILALVVAVATIYLWPLAAFALLYVTFRVFDIHPELLSLVGIIAIATVWWWHVARSNKQP